MGFLEVFVRRPVFTTMVIATMVVLGLASFVQLGVDIFPKVDLPTITITTLLPGASPEEIESQITKPIEEVVNTISGLDELRSSTIEGQSQVFATFVLERSVQEAANDVREKVGTVLSRLPAGTESPIVEKVDPDQRVIWFRAGGIRPGQDPYYVHYCRVNFDGTGLRILTEGDGTHTWRRRARSFRS